MIVIQSVYLFIEKYVPPQPTTHTSQWYHGTLNRAESERIFKQAKSVLDNEVNYIIYEIVDWTHAINGFFLCCFTQRMRLEHF